MKDLVGTHLWVTVLFNVDFIFLGAKLFLRLVELWREIKLCGQHCIAFLINTTTHSLFWDLLLLLIIYQLCWLRQGEQWRWVPSIMYFDTVLSGSLVSSGCRSHSSLPRRFHRRLACFTLWAHNIPGRSFIFRFLFWFAIERDCLSRSALAQSLTLAIISFSLVGQWISAHNSLGLHRCFITKIL